MREEVEGESAVQNAVAAAEAEQEIQEQHNQLTMQEEEQHNVMQDELRDKGKQNVSLLVGGESPEDVEESSKETPLKPCPEYSSNFLSRLTFWWLTPLIMTGYRQVLQISDLFDLRNEERAEYLSETFQYNWNKQKNSSKPSMVWAIHLTYGTRFYMAAFLKIIYDICELASPLFVKFIIQYLDNPNQEWYWGYIYSISLFLLQCISLLTIHQYFHLVMTQGLRLRTGLRTAVYRKSLNLSNQARKKFNSGDLVNMMSVDCQRMGDLLTYLHMIWSAFFQIFVCLIFLFQLIGLSAFSGLVTMIFIIPMNGIFTRLLANLRREVLKFSGERIKFINEILQGIRVIKFYAWENSFLKKVSQARLLELSKIKVTALAYVINSVIMSTGPLAVSVITFSCFALLGNELNPAIIFPALAYFSLLRFPMAFLPSQIGNLAEARVSLGRLRDFLLADEVTERKMGNNSEYPIIVSAGEFSWNTDPELHEKKDTKNKKEKQNYARLDDEKTEKESVSPTSEGEVQIPSTSNLEHQKHPERTSTLQNINLKIQKGKLTCLVGHVGSGKSSLLNAIIGEMKLLKGEISVSGSVAYTAQQAWIQNATVRDNIVFGLPYQRQLYEQVIKVCSLEKDLEILPAGDMTEIGEKGINVSGGQRQRINLARAVYSNADIYLFDDPLSAVDAHVGKSIFESCICGLLKDKTRVLATHQWHTLKNADRIIVIDDGMIVGEGSYDDLLNTSSHFSKMMKGVSSGESLEEDAEAEKTEGSETKEKEETKQESENPGKKKKEDKLMQVEERATGNVKLGIYLSYLKYAGGIPAITFFSILFIGYHLANLANSWWLAFWSSEARNSETNRGFVFYISIYAGLGLSTTILTLLKEALFTLIGLSAAQNLHEKAITKIAHAPTSFFDTTPIGRIINRFSKDTEVIDSQLITILRMFISCVGQVATIFLIITIVTPLFLVPLIPILFVYLRVQQFYRATSREVQRLESISRSPIFAHFSETLTGLSTIRAYNENTRFEKDFFKKLNTNNTALFTQLCCQRWLGVRLEFVGRCIVFLSALFATLSRIDFPFLNAIRPTPAMAGLSLSYSLQITGVLNWAVRQFVEQENAMNAVERVLYYCDEIPQEAAMIIDENRPPKEWPDQGNIKFDKVVLKYRSDLDPVLKNFSAEIFGAEKVGIVGRTGAGKSSLMAALFRLVELESGTIEIDGIDISTIGLEDLRSRLVIIPQDPVLFSGTVRFNLDPFNQYEDFEIWKALERSHLKKKIEKIGMGLEAPVEEYGENFSIGERQLICIARAILRPTKVLIMDEATASVDPLVDNLIQHTIRGEFTDRSTLTIAHRLNTIIDSDRIVVMERGELVEFDNPKKLLENEDGYFSSLVKETGKQNERYLKRIANGEISFTSELEKQIQDQNNPLLE